MSEFVVAGGKLTELLEPIEESLNEVTCLVPLPVKLTRCQSIAAWGNHSLSPNGGDRFHARVNPGRQPAARPADRLIAPVFLGAPAECWWARTTVESMNSSSKSASPRRASATRAQTPPASQRAKRIYTECQLPNSRGRSCHALPTRAVYGTASTNNRLSAARPPLSFGFPGNNSEIRAHCASLNMRRLIAFFQLYECKYKSITVNRH